MINQTEHTFLDVVSEYPMDGYVLRKIFTDLTRIHFSDSSNFGVLQREMGKYTFNPEKPTTSRVKIQAGHTYPTNEENAYPMLSVDVGDIAYRRVGIGDASGPDSTHYAQQATTSLRVHHLAKSIDECWALSSITSAFFFGYSKFIRDRLNLMNFEPKQTTQPTVVTDIKSPDKIYRSVFAAQIDYDYGWTMETEGHILRKISINAVLEMNGN